MKRLLLIGGGHSHVEVLLRFALSPESGVELTLVNPYPVAGYSGMLPGLVAGHYRPEDCHIDLLALARRAACRFVGGAVNGLHVDAKLAFCVDGQTLPWDIASIDIGSRPTTLEVSGAAEYALAVKPIDRFLRSWDALVEEQRKCPSALRVTVVGGGAAGVETALAMQHRLRGAGEARFCLITDMQDVLPTHAGAVRRIFRRVLSARGIEVHSGRKVVAVRPDAVVLAGGAVVASDVTVWATGACAPFWPGACGLATDATGFIRIGPTLQSVNRPDVFASGDIASMDTMPRPKSGVYAVRQGPPLAENLRRALRGQPLLRYSPQRQALALISTGDRHAVASRGRLALEGAWVWKWKDWIDRRFMRRYALE
ncbi:MAG TPA: FAD-dependent oxidoreductase [Burkholderiales bacterium]|nr:FAD-dependent oxidoreductase [Burkholderiales bacterium]